MNYFTIVCLCLGGISCCPTQTLTNPVKEQGISGYVREVSGNRMPSPGVTLPEPTGIKTTLYIYEETNTSQVERQGTEPLYKNIRTKLITTVDSDEDGKFFVSLPPGRYSLFTKINDAYFANLFDEKNTIHPVVVEPDSVTQVEFLININAVY